MKLAYLLPNLHITGGSKIVVELLDQLSNKGIHTTIFVPPNRKKLSVPDRIKVVECGLPISNPILTIIPAAIAMFFKVKKFDLLIASMPPLWDDLH